MVFFSHIGTTRKVRNRPTSAAPRPLHECVTRLTNRKFPTGGFRDAAQLFARKQAGQPALTGAPGKHCGECLDAMNRWQPRGRFCAIGRSLPPKKPPGTRCSMPLSHIGTLWFLYEISPHSRAIRHVSAAARLPCARMQATKLTGPRRPSAHHHRPRPPHHTFNAHAAGTTGGTATTRGHVLCKTTIHAKAASRARAAPNTPR